MAISQLYPDEGPTLNLNFAGSRILDPRITFTRSSTGTYMDSNGLVKLASADQARFDHRYVNGQVESLGLLVEESRSNLVTDTATNYNYSINNQVASTTTDIAPDGTSVLCKHDLTGTTQPFLNCRANTTLSAGNTYTMSMWLKGTTNFSASFAFVGETTGEIPNTSINVTTTWTRFTLTFTLVATQTLSRLQVFFGSQGEGKIISIWGVQLEQGAFATSYIPRTSGQQATRSADNASMTGSNFSSWYNATEGTIFAAARINALGGGTYPGITYVDDGTLNNCIGLVFMDAFNDSVAAEAYASGAAQYFLSSPSAVIPNKLVKAITAYKINDFAGSFDGQTVQTDTSGSVPTVNRLIIGDLRGNNAKLNGTIAQISYYPTRLSNTLLQNLTK